MTEADSRVVALAAALARERAGALLSRLGTPGAADARAEGARLAASPRAGRLRALSAALSPPAAPPGAARARALAIASLERPRIARIVVAAADRSAEPGAAAVLVRLCRERTGDGPG